MRRDPKREPEENDPPLILIGRIFQRALRTLQFFKLKASRSTAAFGFIFPFKTHFILALTFNLTLNLILFLPLKTMAQFVHQGLSFQATIRAPNGSLPSSDNVMVTAQILTPTNDCLLREENHFNVKMSKGYFSLVIGGPSASITGSRNPVPLLPLGSIFNNSQPFSGLTCINADNSVSVTNQAYTMNEFSRRKLRLRITIPSESQPVIAEFNMRAVGFAINSETLGGKKSSDFIAVNNAKNLTQTNIETLFNDFTKLNLIMTQFNSGGTLPIAQLSLDGTGTPFLNGDGNTYLSGDGTWKTVAGGGGAVDSVAGKTGTVTLLSADITDATSSNTASTLVKRDPSGNFAAGTITANSFSGTAVSATGVTTGSLQVTGGSPAAGNILTSDASGNATWAAPAISSQWNNGAASSINYIAGNVGIGTTAPSATMDILGELKLTGVGTDSPQITLTVAMVASDTTMTVSDTAAFPSAGTLLVETEVMSYTNKTATTFSGLTRGLFQTTAAAHGFGTRIANLVLNVNSATRSIVRVFNNGSVGIGVGAKPAGTYSSIAIGGATAVGQNYAVAIGRDAAALGDTSIALGRATANNYLAFATGYSFANGIASTSTGYNNSANGDHSFVGGTGNNANAWVETVFGRYNKVVGTETPTSWTGTDPLFVIGNGASAGTNQNALMVFQNGQMLVNGGTTVAVPSGSASLTVMGTTTDNSASSFNATDSVGNSKLLVRNDGNVGIGTTAPSATLHLDGTAPLLKLTRSTNSADMISLNVEGANRDAKVRFSRSDGTRSSFVKGYVGDSGRGDQIQLCSTANCFIVTGTGGTGTFDNRFGFNTTDPEFLISINGTTAASIGVNRNTTAATAGQNLSLEAGGAYSTGTDLDGGNLTLRSGISTGTGSSSIQFQTATAQGVSSATDNSPTTKMVIDGAGNVGIGTTAPAYKLDVAGDVNITGNFKVNGTNISTGGGSVTSASVVTANGFAGTVATASTTPAITLTTNVNGMVKGDGTALAAAVAGTDYVSGSGTSGGIPYYSSATTVASSGALTANGVVVGGGAGAAPTTTSAPTTTGQVLRYNGTNWVPNFVSMFDLRSTITGAQAFGGVGCLADQTLTWISATDNLSCTNIAISNTQVSGLAASATTDTTNASNITSGTLNSARLPTSVTDALWTASSGNIYRSSGNVGIGTTTPAGALDISNGNLLINNNYINNNGGSVGLSFDTGGRATITDLSGAVSTLLTLRNTSPASGSGVGIEFKHNSVGGATIESIVGASTSNESLAFSTRGSNVLNERMRIDNNGNVGIGTSSPQTKLNISSNESAPRTPNTGSNLQITGADNLSNAITLDAYGNGSWDSPFFTMRRARNTNASPTPVQNNDVLGSLQVAGWDGSNFVVAGEIEASASETWSPSQRGSRLVFRVGKMGTSSSASPLQMTDSNSGFSTSLTIGGNRNSNSWTTTGANFAITNNTLTDISSAASSTIASRTATSLGIPTYASTNPVTITNASTFYIAGPPNEGTNTTITNKKALHVETGDSYFGGNIGIGTTTPTYKLDVAGDVNITGNFKVNGTNISGGILSSSVPATGGTVSSITQTNTDAASASRSALILQNNGTGGTNEMNLISKNAADIITSYISQAGVGSFASSIYAPTIYGSASSSGNLTIDSTSNATKGNINIAPTGGNVGIGTTNPTSTLHIEGSSPSLRISRTSNSADMIILNSEAANRYSNIRFNTASNQTGPYISGHNGHSAGPNRIGLCGDSNLCFVVNGNAVSGSTIYDKTFGFGTALPEFLIGIDGTSAASIGVNRNTTAATAGQNLSLEAGGAYSTGTDLNGGNLTLRSGISTGTGSSSIQFQTATAQGVSSATDNSPTTKMVIDGAGNVGIGTLTPQSKLEVQGKIAVASGGATAPSLTFASDTGSGFYKVASGIGFTTAGINAGDLTTGSLTVYRPIVSWQNGGGLFRAINSSIPAAADLELGQYNFGSAGYATGSSAIRGFSSEAWSGTSNGSYMTLSTTSSGTTSRSERMRITSTGHVGIGTTNPIAKLEISGAVVTPTNEIPTGGVVNLALSNLHYLSNIGGSTITLSNMVNGGVYTLIVSDTTSRTYTFSGCSNTYFSPANAATNGGTQTIYGITTVFVSGSWRCYIAWSMGFQ